MCGRFVLTVNPEMVQQTFGLSSVPAGMQARYNISPTQPVAVITNDDPHALTFYSWGLVPSWAKDTSGAGKLINARSETAAEKPAFRSAFKRRRCIIPSNGFYEWQKNGSDKTPLFIHPEDQELFGFAGLWEVWHSADGSEVRSCTILTAAANDFMKPIHDRMPVILHKADYPLWLSSAEEPLPVLQGLMKAYDGPLTAYPVSKAVNRPINDSPQLMERVQ